MHRDNEKPGRPAVEELQPDPQLQLSSGRASGAQIALTVLACMLIVGIVIYGLNNQREATITASAPPAETTGAETTGAAPQASPSQPPAKMPGESGNPAKEADTPAESQQQAPEPQKGAVPDDSAR